MTLRQAVKWSAMVSMIILRGAAFAAENDNVGATQAVRQLSAPRPGAGMGQMGLIRPDRLPISPIASLTRVPVPIRTNLMVRIQGLVLDQGLGEYVILQDDTGSIRVETRQTTPLGGGERVAAWGRLASDGNHVFLRNAIVRPQAWDSIVQQRIVPAPGKPDQLPTLTQVRQVRELLAEQAAWEYPVRVRGVITTIWKDSRSLFVQDDTAGIYVAASKLNVDTNYSVGDEVEIEGVSGPGDYAPIIDADRATIIGQKNLPPARLVTLYQMASGQFDAQWVEVRGIVRSAHVTRQFTVLELSDLNGLVEVEMLNGDTLTNSIDSLVRVRGICGSRSNPNRQLMGAFVSSPSTNQLVVEEKGVADPFALPVRAIASLSQFSQWRATQHRIRIAGVVTFSQPGRPLFVQDETGGVPVYLAEAADFQPRDSVEVAGYLSPGDFGYVFRNANCRLIGHSQIPSPKAVLAANTLNQNLHGLWVQLSARLVSSSRRANETVLTLQSDNLIFEALHPAGAAGAADSIPPVGSLVQLQGVYAILGDESRQARTLRIYVPSAEPIQLVERPPWWNSRHASTVLGVMAVVVVGAALWGITLRRRVAEQTLVIRERFAKEAALEQRYREIVESSPNAIYIQSEGRIVFINQAGLQVLGASNPEEILGRQVLDLVHPEHREMVRKRMIALDATQTTASLLEEKYLRVDGSIVDVEVAAGPVIFENKRGAQVILHDITERKRAQAAVAEASALLQTLLDHSPDCIYFKDARSRFIRYSKAFERLFNVKDSGQLRGKSDFDFFTEDHARVAYEDEQEIIRSGKPVIGKLERETHQDGRVTWALTTKMPWFDKDRNIIGTFGISKDVTSIKEAELELACERELLRALLDTFPDDIYFKDRECRLVRMSRSKTEMTFDLVRNQFLASCAPEHPKELPPHLSSIEAFARYLIGKSDFDTFGSSHASQTFEEEQAIMRTGEPLIGKLEHAAYPNKWMLVTKMPWRDKDGNIIGTFGMSRDISALKQAEAKLEAAHQRLIEASRLAGMAEVATDVLHNVGNVLNSVNVSCSLTLDHIKSSKVSSLAKVSSLLNENRERLAEFLTRDDRGRQIPEFLAVLSEHLQSEQTMVLTELQQLVKHIDHIKQIVAMQQTYAKVIGVHENVNPVQLVEDALQINTAALQRHNVQVNRDFQSTRQVVTDKHKVLQILVNLIRNAKYATDEAERAEKRVTVKVAAEENGQVRVQVCDNGIGISKENLTRIFSHGFTTRRNGHGFGLHSSALAARELGGSLQVQSDGPGTGATFTLLLPSAPPNHSQEPA